MKTIKFEEALKQLEEIVEELEKGELSLDESLAKYEDGIKIYRKCLELLEGAEERLKVFARDENGRLLVKNLSQGLPEANNRQ
ncbi:MAG: exodeoxyribonuclease VII small subunit [Candidatus Brocadiales bacterium]